MLKPSLNKIISKFDKTMKQLHALADSHQQDINAHDDEILFREKTKKELVAEREKALRIASNIATMLEKPALKAVA